MNIKIKVAVYGFGSTGKKVVDNLLSNKFDVVLIIDKVQRGDYKGIPVIGLDDLGSNFFGALDNIISIIALHNHYIDILPIYDALIEYGFASIHTIVSFNQYIKKFNIKLDVENGYWYESDFSYENIEYELINAQNIFSDETSISLYLNIIKYRRFGYLEDCPIPSLMDEYIPQDLPKYAQPLRLIDCGAHTGSAIERIYSNGYEIDSILAFEPNLNNFNVLSKKTFGSAEITYLPLGLWHSNVLLSFSAKIEDSTSGSLNGKGDDSIQCVRLDSVIKNHKPNLILFDIEGAEIDALIGMEETIRKCKPSLCISLYHRPRHIYQIPLMIDKWNLSYKFYIRVHEYNTFGLILYCLQD
jgi:FkbM family methyltransferase